MKIKGLEELNNQDIYYEIERGGRFIQYDYCISIVVLSFYRKSGYYFVRSGESALITGLPYTLLSLFLGWWGFPCGILFTLTSIIRNLSGGKDVTREILQEFIRTSQNYQNSVSWHASTTPPYQPLNPVSLPTELPVPPQDAYLPYQ